MDTPCLFANKYSKDNSLLQLPIFYFCKNRPTERVTEWCDSRGEKKLVCRCASGVPGAFEQDVYNALLYISANVENSANELYTNCAEIARTLNLDPNKWYGQIRKALRTLAEAVYEFTECFIAADADGNKTISTSFSLLHSLELFRSRKGVSNRVSKSKITFPELIIANMKRGYQQILDLKDYLSLASGLSRRAYEFFRKKLYQCQNGKFAISEERFARWLGVCDTNTTNRHKTIKKALDKIIAEKFLKNYFFDTKTKVYIFWLIPKNFFKKTSQTKKSKDIADVIPQDKHDISRPQQTQPPIPAATPQSQTTELTELLATIKLPQVPKTLSNIIADYYQRQGYNYVKRNILYANTNSQSNYSSYLSICLKQDHAKMWAEEQDLREQRRQAQQILVENPITLQATLSAQDFLAEKQRFFDIAMGLDREILASLKQQAVQKCCNLEGAIGRIATRAQFSHLLQEYIGGFENFAPEVVHDIALTKKIYESL